jgi:hypothetical protein
MWIFDSIKQRRLRKKCLDEILGEAEKQGINLTYTYLDDDKQEVIRNKARICLEEFKKQGCGYTLDFFVQDKNCTLNWVRHDIKHGNGSMVFSGYWLYGPMNVSPIPEGFIEEPIGETINPRYNDYSEKLLKIYEEVEQRRRSREEKNLEKDKIGVEEAEDYKYKIQEQEKLNHEVPSFMVYMKIDKKNL